MSRSLPHLTLTISTSSLSPTSPIFPTISPTHTHKTLRRSTTECRINTNPISHMLLPHGSLPLEQCGTCTAPPAAGGQTSKTTPDTMQCAQSKAHQLLKWQQDSWTRFPDFPVWHEKPMTRYQQHASTCVGSSQIAGISGIRMATRMGTTSTESKSEKLGFNPRISCSS